MADRETIGGGLLLIGLAAVGVGAFLGYNTDVMTVGTILTVLGVVIAAWDLEVERDWYCAACGQYLGEGGQPNGCTRCGSNRVTTEDPGVGQAVRIKDERRRR
ncbi:hypothetical protein [Salinigranum halophilum]|uniref:hypothetical protein n=1 Tax=Salinigranum halophilum TaxID=2565931 RepID=UPI00115EF81E|nr:hypothetical protein [Salinigranum halophilum]